MAAVRHLEFQPERLPARRHLELVPREPRRSPRRTAAVYRRRRIVVGVVVGGLLVVALMASAPADGVRPTGAPQRAGTVRVVQPGDTYWSIASSLDRPGSLVEAVDALVVANGEAVLQPGDEVVLPG